MKIKTTSAVLLFSALSALPSAQAAFSHSATLIVSGYAGPAVANFPVLIRLSPERVSGFSYDQVTSPTGADIAFSSEEGQAYPHEIDTWNPDGESLVWVRLPSLEPNARVVLQWGDESVTARPASRDLWSSVGSSKHYFGVWHMGEEILTGAGSALSADSARYFSDVSMDATPIASYSGSTASMTSDENGIVGRSRWNSKTNGRFLTALRAANSSGQAFGSAITLSGWFNASDVSQNEYTFFARRDYNGENIGFYVCRTIKGKLSMSGGSGTVLEVAAPDFLDQWVHLACVYDGSVGIIYVNGVEAGRSQNLTAPGDVDRAVAFGAASSGQDFAFGGRYDEIRLLGAAASADWVSAEYQTVTKQDFVTEYVAGKRDVTLVAEPSGAGLFSVDGTPVDAGTVPVPEADEVTFAVQPAAGYEFLRWEGADVRPQDVASSEIVLPVFAARTLKAVFLAADPSHVATDVTWSSGVPTLGSGDRVTVPAGATVVLSAPTPHLASFDVSGTVVVSNWFSRIFADAITVREGGAVKAGCDAPMLNGGVSNRVWLAGTSLDVEAGGVVSADGAGYAGTNGPCWTAAVTRKVVNAAEANISPYGGAYGGTPGYDGLAEFGTFWGVAPEPYGSAEWPFDPGSGGGAYVRAGGGAVFLDFAGAVRIDGSVRADAASTGYSGYPPWESDIGSGWHYNNAPYGSGGGIVIRCLTVSGTGTVSASSCAYTDSAAGYGGGSGGRVSVHYTAAQQSATTCGVRFETVRGVSYGGKNAIPLRGPYAGGPGTLWFTDNGFLASYAATGWKFGGEWHSGVGTPNPLAVDGNLTIDGALLRFVEEDLAFSVSGDLTLTGAKPYAKMCGLSFASRTAFSVGGSVRLTDAMLEFAGGGTADVAGDFTMDDSAARRSAAMLVLQAAPTNSPSDVAMRFAVKGAWSLGKYAICLPICDSDDGAAPTLAAGSLFVDDDAEINASGFGFAPKKGPGYVGALIGASHGGTGGGKNGKTPRPVYDVLTEPLMPGSGDYAVSFGGGVVNLTVAGTANMRGKILADSLNTSVVPAVGYQAGSSGGSVNLRAYRLRGGTNSLVSAVGGASWNTMSGRWYYNDTGVGGGGRIAIRTAVNRTDWRDNPERMNVRSYASGSESLDPKPTDGTVWWGDLPALGFMLLLR